MTAGGLRSSTAFAGRDGPASRPRRAMQRSKAAVVSLTQVAADGSTHRLGIRSERDLPELVGHAEYSPPSPAARSKPRVVGDRQLAGPGFSPPANIVALHALPGRRRTGPVTAGPGALRVDAGARLAGFSLAAMSAPGQPPADPHDSERRRRRLVPRPR